MQSFDFRAWAKPLAIHLGGVVLAVTTMTVSAAAQTPQTVSEVLQDVQHTAANDAAAKTELGSALGLQAYILATPYVYLDTWRTQLLKRLKFGGVSSVVNTFVHQPALARPGTTAEGAPNVDTIYSTALLDLSQGPVALTIPSVRDRYYSIQIASAALSNVALLSRRTRGTLEGRYLLVGPKYQGKAVRGVTTIRMPTNEGLILARTFAANPGDLAGARAVQKGLILKGPASAANSPILSPAGGDGPLGFYDRATVLYQRNPPGAAEAAVLRSLAPAGLFIGPDQGPLRADPQIQDGLKLALADGPKVVARGIRELGEHVGLWTVTYKGGAYGDDYLGRAAGAVGGLLLLDPEEALYFRRYVDDANAPLDGATSYKLRVKPNTLKGCGAFWSLTSYDSSSRLIPNKWNHFAVNDRDPSLKRDTDGGITVEISHAPQANETANWLPSTEKGAFTVVLRCYEPGPLYFDKARVADTLPSIVTAPQQDQR